MVKGEKRLLVRAALDELLEWDELKRSPQLGNFLHYVVERTLDGQESSLKAYTIAVDVLGRPGDFDPQSDPIVRVQAARLRSLLDRFYDTGQNTVPLRISIPVGRYVPRFSAAPLDKKETVHSSDLLTFDEPVLVEKDAAEQTVRGSSRQWPRSMVPLLAMLIVVLVAAMLTIWLLADQPEGEPQRTESAQRFDVPTLRVGVVKNLTGLDLFDAATEALGQKLIADLSRFEFIDIEREVAASQGVAIPDEGNSVYALNGVLRRGEADFYYYEFLLSRTDEKNVIWTQSFNSIDADDEVLEGMAELSRSVSAAVGDLRGPVHAQARSWLANSYQELEEINAYSCHLLSSLARDNRSLPYRRAALACYAKLREKEPQNAYALAGWAVLKAVAAMETAPLGEPLAGKLFEETQAALLAAELAPYSGVISARLAKVLAVQGLNKEARESYQAALLRNPADCDARVELAMFLAYNGDWQAGNAEFDKVLAMAKVPPAWYFELHAFNDFREGDYEHALSDALRLLRASPDIGKVLALAAAPLAARSDIVERYLMDVHSDPKYQENGILPRLSRRIQDEEVLQLLVPGLQLSGVPTKAIYFPFGPEDYKGLTQ